MQKQNGADHESVLLHCNPDEMNQLEADVNVVFLSHYKYEPEAI